jgi:ABC-type polysaccharide/polyol phosphate transport system ATPase subunit
MTAIKLTNVSKRYKVYSAPHHKLKEVLLRGLLRNPRWTYHQEFWAVQGIDLEIRRGETFGIIGRNGSGKTTLLQIIAGILQPTTGSVDVQGRISTLLELGAGFNPDFTGRENVYMNGAIRGMSRREMDKRFGEIEAFADIGAFIDQPVRTYSNGMFVRLAFATAIHLDPDILIIDEVLAVGDEMYRRRCYQKIHEFQNQRKTIVFTSHSLQVVKSLCSRAMLLDKGRIVEIADANRIVHVYNELITANELVYAQKYGRSVPESRIPDDDRFQTPSVTGTERGTAEYRYGSGSAEIIRFELLDQEGKSVSAALFGEPYTVRVIAKFHKDVDQPQVGMRITTLTGIAVTGTTTAIEGLSLGPVKSGEELTVEFDFDMKLKPDTYTLSVGVSETVLGGDIVPLDRRMDAMVFNVLGSKKPRGLVDLGFDIRIRSSISK